MKSTLLVLLFILSSFVVAQTQTEDLPYLFIAPIESPQSFSDIEKQTIHKIIVRACTKQTLYQLLIGRTEFDKKLKWDLHRLNVQIRSKNEEYEITAELKDGRKEKIYNHIQEGHILRLDLYRRLEEILNQLFNLPTTEKLSESRPKPPKTQSAQLFQLPPESETASVNFRERIMNLQSGVQNAFELAKAEKEKPKQLPSSGTNNSESKTSETNKANSESISKGDEAVDLPIPFPPKSSLPLDIGHAMRVGYYQVNTNSKDNALNTDSHPKYLLVDYEYARNLSHQSKFYHHINLRYGKTLNKQEKEFAPYTGGAYYMGYFVQRFSWMPKLGLEMDTISFKNLPVIGRGLQIANNRILWAQIASVNNFELSWLKFRISLAYNIPLMLSSGYKGLDQNPHLSGSKYNVTFAVLNVFRNFHLEINYFKSALTATSVREIYFDTQGAGINAFYIF